MRTGIALRLAATTAIVVALLGVTWLVALSGAGVLRASYIHTVTDLDALSNLVLQGSKLRGDEETALRGYLLTGRPEFLQPYTAARQALPALQRQVDALTVGDPGLRPLIAQRRHWGNAWDRWALGVLQHPTAYPRGSAALIAEQRTGKALFDRYRAETAQVLAVMDATRQADLRESLATMDRMYHLFSITFAGAIGLGLLLGWRSTRAVTLPLSALGRAAQAVGRGDLARPIAIAGAREFVELGERMEWMRKQLAAQQALAALLSSTLRLEDIYVEFAARVRDLVPYECLSLTILEDAGRTVVVTDLVNSRADQLSLSTHYPLQDTTTRYLLAANTPAWLVRADLAAMPDANLCHDERMARGVGLRAAALLPLRAHGEVFGALNLWSSDPDAYTADSLAPLLALTPLVSAALQNARAHATAAEAARVALERADELAATQGRLRTVIANAPIVLSALDAQGRITFSEGSALEALGVAPNASVGHTIFERYGDHPAIHDAARRALAGEASTCIIDLSGLTFESHYTPLLGSQGQITGVIVTGIDITQRTRAEAAVRESEELYRRSFRDAAIGMALVSTEGRYLRVNPALCALLGYDEADLLDRSFAECTHPDDRPASAELMRCLLAGEREAADAEKRYLRKDGEVVWVRISISLLRDEHGQPLYLVNQTQDISARKRAETALRQERQLLRDFIANAPVNIALLDRDLRYLAHSRQWLQEHGLDGQEIIGRSHDDLLPRIPEHWKALHPRALAGEALSSPEDAYARPDGSRGYMRWAITPWRDSSGEVGGIVLLTLRIDDLVAAREAALDVERHKAAVLAEANDELIRASNVKSAFLATMSHEIRTPMSGVIGMTELLLETPLSPDQREYAAIVRDSGQALLSIINDILDFAKIEAGKLELERIEMSPPAIVETSTDLLTARARAKGLSLMTFVSPEIPELALGDPGRLRQVLLNLLSNAVKFTERGEVVVRADLEEATETEMMVRFSVGDTGIGLSRADQARLFQPFTQADGSTTRKYGGTGLGLAICKQLVELMGGEIGVKSEEGRGSTFWFTAHLERSATPAAPSPHAADLRDLHVLIVDDSPTDREILGEYLRSWGMRPSPVAGGAEALALLRRQAGSPDPIALALVDLTMPNMDGFALARALQRQPDLAAIPLILITAFDAVSQGEQALRAGFAAYLTKPVKRSTLLDAITIAAQGGVQAPRSRSHPLPPTPPAQNGAMAPDTAADAGLATILLAEDNPVNQQLALVRLRKLGYGVHVVANGREAVTAAAGATYALCLMDCQMPEMDGYEAARAIREAEDGSGRRLPIVAMTANAMREDRERCLAAGMDDHLAKPVDIQTLQAMLARWAPPHPPTPSPAQERGVQGGEIAGAQGQAHPPTPTPEQGRGGDQARDFPQPATPLPAGGAPATPLPRLGEGPGVRGSSLDPRTWRDLRQMEREGAPGLIEGLIDDYLERLPSLLTALRGAVTGNNAPAMMRAAHELSGSSLSLGAQQLAQCCRTIEVLGKQDTTAGAPALLDALEQEAARVEAAMRQERHTGERSALVGAPRHAACPTTE